MNLIGWLTFKRGNPRFRIPWYREMPPIETHAVGDFFVVQQQPYVRTVEEIAL